MIRVFECNELGARIRTSLDDNGEPLFMARDAARSLGYVNLSKAILTHVSEENKSTLKMSGVAGTPKSDQ